MDHYHISTWQVSSRIGGLRKQVIPVTQFKPRSFTSELEIKKVLGNSPVDCLFNGEKNLDIYKTR